MSGLLRVNELKVVDAIYVDVVVERERERGGESGGVTWGWW